MEPSLFKKNNLYLPLHQQEKSESSDDIPSTGSVSSSSVGDRRGSNRVSLKYSSWIPWILVSILTLSNLFTWVNIKSNKEKDVVFSPASTAIRYKNILLHSGVQEDLSLYQGPPSEETDHLWESLYNFRISKIPMSDAAQMVNKTVPISNDPGFYVITLDVFHQLHCLNKIRHAIYKNGTIPAEGETEDGLTIYHLDHCIDSLRQTIMCAGDITPSPFAWYRDFNTYSTYSGVLHTCRDFEAIQEWARERQVDDFDTKTQVEDPLGKVIMDTTGHVIIE